MSPLCWFGVFFFQAEDGIRDLVRSRGLGDVYKRQFAMGLTLIAATLAFTVGCTTGQRDASNYDDTEEALSLIHI